MKARFFPLLIPAILTLSLCAPAHAKPIPPAIQARYASFIAAIERCDTKALDTFYAPHYVDVNPDDKATKRAKYLADMHTMMKGAKSGNVKLKYSGTKTHDGIVDVSFDLKMTLTMTNGSTTIHRFGVDSWQKIGGVWLEVKTVDKELAVATTKSETF